MATHKENNPNAQLTDDFLFLVKINSPNKKTRMPATKGKIE